MRGTIAKKKAGRAQEVTSKRRQQWRRALLLARENGTLRMNLVAAEAERRRLAVISDTAPVGLFVVDELLGIVDVNRTGASMLGVVRPMLLGVSFLVYVDPSDAAHFIEHVMHAFIGLRSQPCQVTLGAHKGGSTQIEAFIETRAGNDARGRRCCRLSVSRMTEQLRNRTALVERHACEDELRDQIAAVRRRHEPVDAVGALLAESLDLEETAARAARVPLPDLASFCSVDLINADGCVHRFASASASGAAPVALDPYAPKGSASVVRSGQPLILLEVSPADALALATLPCELSEVLRVVRSYLCFPLVARGRTIGAMSFLRSGSQRFSADEAGRAEDIARQVAIVLDNALLYRSAQDADRRKDEFLATPAHELRNPLAAITMATGLLQAKGANVAKVAGVVERQTSRLVRLVDDLLDVSRITRGKIALHAERVVLSDIIAHAVESVRPLIHQRRHDLTINLPDTPIVLIGDPARLEQVFVNLVGNAARYTPAGGRIAVEAERSGPEIVVRVRDNGRGIAREMLARIFEPFTRVGVSLDHGDRGLGIGLTLSRGLIELHGGRLTAESPGLGLGSEFVVRLAGEECNVASLPSPTSGRILLERAPRRRRVLLVEDEADVAEVTRTWLEALGHDVRVARDGLAAVETALAFRPEILLVDLGLPGLSGYDVAVRLKREPSLAEATFVALTGFGDEAARRRSLAAGFDRHATKPITDPILLEMLGAAVADAPPPVPPLALPVYDARAR